MATYVKAIIYTAVAVWAIALLVTGQKLSFDLLRPLSGVTSIVVLLAMAFELWLWKLSFLHGWFVKRPLVEGSWHAELRSNWKDGSGAPIPPIEGYVVIRQTLLNLSLRLLTKESSSHLVGTEIVCAADGQYCVSGVYRNEPRYQDRGHSQIHFGAVWLQVIDTPTQMLQGHYWTDRNTAGEMLLTDRQKPKFQDFKSAQAYNAQLPPTKT
jgi:SMODS-associating 2TM, beta-strand rich effector domain